MKLRIYKNSLRIRLDDDDLASLIETGSVAEELRDGIDPDGCLVYSVETRDGKQAVSAELREGQIRVFIRPEIATSLADESVVAVEAAQAVDGGPDLRLLVEKEFLP